MTKPDAWTLNPHHQYDYEKFFDTPDFGICFASLMKEKLQIFSRNIWPAFQARNRHKPLNSV
jgi:hypothetical protein